ncbi:MAG: cupin domain-containing protein [Rhodoferax sp.]
MSNLSATQQTEASSLKRPEGASLEAWMNARIARHATRKYDWEALKFQADYDPKYRRSQMRYVGTGGTGVAGDNNTVPAEHFTFSTMVLPAGHEGPLHIHYDVEEVFFVLRGKVKMIAESVDGKEKWEAIVGERDLISWPPGVYRGEINIGDEEALMLVMLGAAKPQMPTYRPNDPLSKLKR